MSGSVVAVAIGAFEDLLVAGLCALVEGEPSLRLAGAGLQPAELERVLRRKAARVAIIDAASLGSPIGVRRLAERFPDARFVLIADGLSSAEGAQLLAFGASACLSRSAQARDVLSSVHMAARGLQLTPRTFAPASGAVTGLTEREAEVLGELQRSRANAQIASDLHISVETVRTHARSIYRKLGVSSRRELLGATARDPGAPPAAGAQDA
ncbi:MAG TPA: response regulator transcription factor [Solirubrobacteraceae bacterium]|nr:response regulator transcription factor [Solirubrobacteraceae bacterium]